MSDWLTQLDRLSQLRDRGALTEEEFQEQKRRLLPTSDKVQSGQPVISYGFSGGEIFFLGLFALLIVGAAIAALVTDFFFIGDFRMSNRDDGVVELIAIYVIPSLFIGGLVASGAQVRVWVYAVIPVALLAARGLVSAVIVTFRFENMLGVDLTRNLSFVGDVAREGFWFYGGASLALLVLGLTLFGLIPTGSRRPRGSTSEWLLSGGMLLFVAGLIYPALQPMRPLSRVDRILDPDFTAYVSTFKNVPWEFFIADSIILPYAVLVGCLIVLWAPSERSYLAGLCGILYVAVAWLALLIAANAEGEQEVAWSLGGWMAAAGAFMWLLAVAAECWRQAPKQTLTG